MDPIIASLTRLGVEEHFLAVVMPDSFTPTAAQMDEMVRFEREFVKDRPEFQGGHRI